MIILHSSLNNAPTRHDFKDFRVVWQQHKSFRLTPPPYMSGRRVIPRLWWFASIAQGVGLATSLCGFPGGLLWAEARFGLLTALGPVTAIAFPGISLLGYYLGLLVCSGTALMMRLISRKQALELLTMGRTWPEAWLERLDMIERLRGS